jgi:hypothetical protein
MSPHRASATETRGRRLLTALVLTSILAGAAAGVWSLEGRDSRGRVPGLDETDERLLMAAEAEDDIGARFTRMRLRHEERKRARREGPPRDYRVPELDGEVRALLEQPQ